MEKTTAPPSRTDLVFLKLGGSLITDKLSPRSPRLRLIERLSTEISVAMTKRPQLRILLGHGSGSFGHVSGSKYHTLDGVSTPAEWQGFTKVWKDASNLNHLIMNGLHQAGLPALAFPPSASAISQDRIIQSWNLKGMREALKQGLVPVVYGDVVFDTSLGGTILSTEDLFCHLAPLLTPGRILLAGIDPGVWQDYPERTTLFKDLTPADKATMRESITQSAAVDVTGGMVNKVDRMLALVEEMPSLEVLIFSGEAPGSLQQALLGDYPGTRLHS